MVSAAAAAAEGNNATATLPHSASSASRKSSRRSGRTTRTSSSTTSSSGGSSQAFLIIVLLGASFAIAVLAILIGPELYAFYNSKQLHKASQHGSIPSFAAFLSLRAQERAAARAALNYGHSAPLLRLRSRIFNSPLAQQTRIQWANSILASLPPSLSIPGLLDHADEQQRTRLQQLTLADHIHLLTVTPHTHLPWPLNILPGLFRLAAALSLMPIALIGVADFAGYAVFRTLGLQRRRVRIKRSTSPPSLSKGDQDARHQDAKALRQSMQQLQQQQQHEQNAQQQRPTRDGHSSHQQQQQRSLNRGGPSPLPFPRPPGSGPVSPQPGEAGGAPLLTPGAYDAAVLLRHRARSRSASGTESADAEAEWARTGGSFARVSAVREAASRAKREAEALGIPPLTLPSVAAGAKEGGGAAFMPPSGACSPTDLIGSTSRGGSGGGDYIEAGAAAAAAAAAARAGARGGAGSVANSPGASHANLLSPPASPRTRFFQLRIPGVIGQEGALGMHDLTDFEDSGAESGTSSPVHGFSRASSISSAQGVGYSQQLSGSGSNNSSVRVRSHRPRIGGFTPLATPSAELAPSRSAGGGAVASAHTSDGDSEDAEGEALSNSPAAVRARTIAKAAQQSGGRAANPHSGSSSSSSSSSNAAALLLPPRKHAQFSATAAGSLPAAQPPSLPTSPSSVRKALMPDPNVLSRTLRTLANVAKSALTPGPLDPDVARLTEANEAAAAAATGHLHGYEGGLGASSEGGNGKAGNLLGLHGNDGSSSWENTLGSAAADKSSGGGGGGRPRRVSLFGDEEINTTYSGAGLVAGLHSADTEL
ncbi:hypothetical protein V8E36_005829 [Tilletia maclaganii]